MAKSNDQGASVNIIGAGTIIKGEVTCNGDIRVDGTVTGSVHSKGKVVIGSTGMVEGEVTCQNADISGGIKGNITITELLSLKATANLNGDITTNKLSIEPGANFSGSCSMGGVVKDIKHAERTEARAKTEKTA